MASAIHAENPSFDFRKQFALFSVSYCPESQENPSTAFKLTSARLVHNPPPNTPMGANFAAFRPVADESDKENHGNPGYQGLLVCVCQYPSRTPLQIQTNCAQTQSTTSLTGLLRSLCLNLIFAEGLATTSGLARSNISWTRVSFSAFVRRQRGPVGGRV